MQKLLVALVFMSWSTAFAYDKSAKACPGPSALDHYVENDLFPDLLAKRAEVRNIPNLRLHQELVLLEAGKKLNIYFEMLKPYDSNKELLILIPGGPGGDHGILHDLGADLAKRTALLEKFNVVAMDHRGLGCSRPIYPGSIPALAYEMRFAATDIEVIRQHLGAEKVNLLGGSYGSMLGQTYALLFPQHIDRLFLRGAVSSSQQMTNWDETFLGFLSENSNVMKFVNDLKSLDPALADLFFDQAFQHLYTYRGRTQGVSEMAEKLQPLLQQKDREGIRRELSVLALDVTPPMSRALICLELFQNPPEDGRYHIQRDLRNMCGEFAGLLDYFDYRSVLSQLPARTLIWGGQYDVVTPAVAMEFLHASVPGSFLYLDPHLGHSPREKIDCFTSFIAAFFTDQGDDAYRALGNSAKCTDAPSLEKFKL